MRLLIFVKIASKPICEEIGQHGQNNKQKNPAYGSYFPTDVFHLFLRGYSE